MIYLDHAATTPTDPNVLEAMLPYFCNQYGNASSEHTAGRTAAEAVAKARQQIADLIQVSPEEIYFTSGATEAINWAADLCLGHDRYQDIKVFRSAIEHKAVINAFDVRCERSNRIPKIIATKPTGEMAWELLAKCPDLYKELKKVVACMWINNETGVVQPIEKLAQLKKETDFTFFCDATQAIGKIPVHPKEMGIDLMAMSAHKFYGPKGVGALYISKDRFKECEIFPFMLGGGQEGGLRGGTLNVPGIVGMGKAAEMAAEYQLDYYMNQLERNSLPTIFELCLQNQLEGVHINGIDFPIDHAGLITNISFDGIDAAGLIDLLGDKIAFSRGSACNALDWTPSYVLESMSLSEERLMSACRFSFGRYTTMAEVDEAVGLIVKTVKALRA